MLVRLVWTTIGPASIFFVAATIATRPPGLALLDGVFWFATFAVVGARIFDVRRLHGVTADGQPATRSTLRRFVLAVLAAGGAVWGLAHAIARALAG